jgi:hypothetical protein
MDRLDHIRARLTARERGRKGPLQSLRSAFQSEPQRPLLGPLGEPPLGPAPRTASPELPGLSGEAGEWAGRRTTFGQRPATGIENLEEPLLLVDEGAEPKPAPPLITATPPSEGVEPPDVAPRPDVRARALLERLELRLIEEQVGLIRRIAYCNRA